MSSMTILIISVLIVVVPLTILYVVLLKLAKNTDTNSNESFCTGKELQEYKDTDIEIVFNSLILGNETLDVFWFNNDPVITSRVNDICNYIKNFNFRYETSNNDVIMYQDLGSTKLMSIEYLIKIINNGAHIKTENIKITRIKNSRDEKSYLLSAI